MILTLLAMLKSVRVPVTFMGLNQQDIVNGRLVTDAGSSVKYCTDAEAKFQPTPLIVTTDVGDDADDVNVRPRARSTGFLVRPGSQKTRPLARGESRLSRKSPAGRFGQSLLNLIVIGVESYGRSRCRKRLSRLVFQDELAFRGR